jgi:hypothetical protein
MEHKVSYDPNTDIVHVDIIGPVMRNDAGELVDALEQNAKKGKTNLLLADLSQTPNLNMDRETRRYIQEKGKSIYYDKMAVIGASPVTRMLAKIVMGVIGRPDTIKFFTTEGDAVGWLKDANNEGPTATL